MRARAARGEITDKQARDFRKGDYKKLPEKKDGKRKGKRSAKR